MPSSDHTRLARACYEAYETGDWRAIENLIADDFAFWSPQDEVVVTYEAERQDGSRFRNTEVLTFAGDQLKLVEVYFGWNL